MSYPGRSMLVVTANWGIGDGTLVGGPGPTRAAAFVAALRRTVFRAGCRRDGGYRPVERVDVVFAGDTFDWLVSRRWSDRHRPWHGGRDSVAIRGAVARASLARAWQALHGVIDITRRGLRVPAADRHGRPSLERLVTVPVGLVLLAGDRDAWLEHAGGARLAGRLGMWLGAGTGVDGVVIHHGHDAGPPDRSRSAPGDGEGGPTLLESVLVDLLVPFALSASVQRRLVRRLAAVESPLDMPALVAAEGARAVAGGAARQQVRLVDAWRRSVDDWRRRAARWMPRSAAPFDPLDALAGWLVQVDPLPSREPAPLLAAVTGPPDPRAFAAAASLTVLGHPAGRRLPAGLHCLCLGPRPQRSGTASGAATTVGGPGSAWVVPGAGEPERAVVLEDPPGIGSVTPLVGFDDGPDQVTTTASGVRAGEAA